MYCAIRDYLEVIYRFPSIKEAYLGLIQCLVAIKWLKEASEWLVYYRKRFPYNNNKEELEELENMVTASQSMAMERNEDDRLPEKMISEHEKLLRLQAWDYERRFLGHCNTTTDIKEANFLGKLWPTVFWC